MRECRWTSKVEAHFDGEAQHASADVLDHLQNCAACADYCKTLDAIRTGAQSIALAPEISDAQFDAFLDGVREGLDAPATRRRPLWAMFSLAAAAIIIALATFLVITDFNGPSRNVEATVVESAYSELQGATVDVEIEQNGGATVWVNNAPNDIWYGNS